MQLARHFSLFIASAACCCALLCVADDVRQLPAAVAASPRVTQQAGAPARAASSSANATSEPAHREAGALRAEPQHGRPSRFRLPTFEAYQKLFRRTYSSARERLLRLKQFMASTMRVAASLLAFRNHKAPYRLAINQFSDRTWEERRRRVGVSAPDDAASALGGVVRARRDIRPVPKWVGATGTVDWREREPSGCLPAPGPDQDDCGCCYAMAILKLLEWDHCRQSRGRPRLHFSAQYIVDCGRPFGLKGCRGGNPDKTLEFIRTAGVLEEARMPFLAEERPCPAREMIPVLANATNGAASVLVRAHRHSAALLPRGLSYRPVKLDEWLEELHSQPLVVYANLSDEFLDYGAGVFDARGECDPELGHFMLLVGRGLDPSTRRPYWLLSNSFGEDFGESGYVRLAAEGRDSRDSKSNYGANCLYYAMKASAEF